MKKFYCFVLIIINLVTSAQVAISEVYYDTPVIERIDKSPYAYAGEFIELFNYTTADIDISNWIISDSYGNEIIPNGTIIEAGQFIILRRSISGYDSDKTSSDDYFYKMFKEVNVLQDYDRKLLPSTNIILNNYKEEVTLKAKTFNGNQLDKTYIISTVSWECKNKRLAGQRCDSYRYTDALINGHLNYNKDYYVKSFQRDASNMRVKDVIISRESQFRRATPFSLDFMFDLIDLLEIEQFQEILGNNPCIITGGGHNVNNVLNTHCNNNIPTISINDFVVKPKAIKCFKYDSAGNQLNDYDCENEKTVTVNPVANVENYENYFYLAPNPTKNITTLSWDAVVNSMIANIEIVPLNGGFNIPIASNMINDRAVRVDMSPYPSGIYVVRFHLTSDIVVTKHLMKH
ncbi:hypothetical protein GO491_01130 [Flavobacteriaceae bacterium Ap0902]|nr:hypothetical protein [Flavobacteriaceae bacterium Ap0902]